MQVREQLAVGWAGGGDTGLKLKPAASTCRLRRVALPARALVAVGATTKLSNSTE